MRILHVVDSLDPTSGGPALVSISLASAQAAIGHDVYIIHNDATACADAIAKAHAIIPGANRVQRINLESPGYFEKITSRRAMVHLRRLVHSESFVHLHGIWEPTLWRAAALARDRGVGYAVRPLSLLHPWQMERYVWQKKIVFLLGVQRMLDRASFIHALNADEARFVRQYASHTPIEVIPNGVFMEQFEPWPAPGAFHARHPELGGRPYILFLSRLHRQKGMKYLADAFHIVAGANPDIHLVVAGPDRGEGESFKKWVSEAGLISRVHLVGPLYGAEKTEALVGATCYCLPSLNEGFSMAVTEALACGLPVVISEQCFFPEVAVHGAGYVVSLDPGKIAVGLLNLLDDPAQRQRMSAAARRLVEEHYTWPCIARLTLANYRKRQ